MRNFDAMKDLDFSSLYTKEPEPMLESTMVEAIIESQLDNTFEEYLMSQHKDIGKVEEIYNHTDYPELIRTLKAEGWMDRALERIDKDINEESDMRWEADYWQTYIENYIETLEESKK